MRYIVAVWCLVLLGGLALAQGAFVPTEDVIFDSDACPERGRCTFPNGVTAQIERSRQTQGRYRVQGIFRFNSMEIPEGKTVTFRNFSDVALSADQYVRIHGTLRHRGEDGLPGGLGGGSEPPFGGNGGDGGGSFGLGGQGGHSPSGCDGAGERGIDGRGAATFYQPTSARAGESIPCPGQAGAAAGGSNGTPGAQSTGRWSSGCPERSGPAGLYVPREVISGADFDPYAPDFRPAGGGSGGGGGCPSGENNGGGGGGGGAGGGSLAIFSRGPLTISATGVVDVRGGHGGAGGDSRGYGGGGGGGGAGGSIYLHARSIQIDGVLRERLPAQGGRGGAGGRGSVRDGAAGPGGGGGRIALVSNAPMTGITPDNGQAAQGQNGGAPTLFTMVAHMACQSGICRRVAGAAIDDPRCSPEQRDAECASSGMRDCDAQVQPWDEP